MTQRVRAGKLRHVVDLRTVTQTPDGSGGQTESYATLATVYASIERVTETEELNAGMLHNVVTHRIRFRHHVGLTVSDRIRFGSREFEIVSIDNFEERDFVDEAQCFERSI